MLAPHPAAWRVTQTLLARSSMVQALVVVALLEVVAAALEVAARLAARVATTTRRAAEVAAATVAQPRWSGLGCASPRLFCF